MKRAALVVALGLLGPAAGARAQDDVVLRAMRDELARSMRLQLDTLPKPYFIAYRVDETASLVAGASLGSLLHSVETRNRLLTVELRVGDYAFDNTNYLGTPGLGGLAGGIGVVAQDDDYGTLRRQIWLATDAAYKRALEELSRKRAALQDAMPTDSVPDFSREDVVTTTDDAAAPLPVRQQVDALVVRLSALFREAPALQRSMVDCRVTVTRTRYVNSEGTSFTRTTPWVSVTAVASTQAQDGRPLADSYQAAARLFPGLPAAESLAARVRGLAARLGGLQRAAEPEAYSGPVLFEGQAAAQLFGQVFAPRLVASRRPVADNPMMERIASQRDNPFMDELGSRVLPRSLSVTDDPTLIAYEDHPVAGFRVDDDGVLAHRTALVNHGMLRTLLVTRVPVRGMLRSTGNRRGGGVAFGTLVVSADSGLSTAALRARLLDLAEARGLGYGILVRRIAESPALQFDPVAALAAMSGSASSGPVFAATEAVKLFPDGREEPIRSADVGGITAQTFREIVAVSAAHGVYTTTAFGGPSTYAVPSLLFEEAIVRPPRGEAPRLPVLSPPWAR